MYFHELNPVGLPQEVADVRLAQARVFSARRDWSFGSHFLLASNVLSVYIYIYVL